MHAQHSRQEALALGLSMYTGSPCKYGHPGIRYVGNKACRECVRIDGAARKSSNEDTERQRKAQWKRDNPDKVRSSKAAYRARLRGAGTATATQADVHMGLALQSSRCGYCGSQENLHLDHKRSLANGGQHVRANLQWLCGYHNMSKGRTDDSVYRQAHGIPDITEWDNPLW